MTLKFPLINLISRGHLPLANKTACLNFVKNIEDGPATRICYEMMKFDDSYNAAKFLENVTEAYRVATEGSRAYFAENSDFANARDMILIREASPYPPQEPDAVTKVASIVSKYGAAAGVAYLLTMSPEKRNNILTNLKLTRHAIYNTLYDSYLGRALRLKQDPNYYAKFINSKILGAKQGNVLSPAELKRANEFISKVKKVAGWGAVIATGMVAAITAISMTYKRFFSKEARQCKALSGKARTVCMTKARIKACDAAIEASKKAILECSSAKNEEDCVFKLKVEIRSWTKKKLAEEEKLRKLTNVNTESFKSNDPFA